LIGIALRRSLECSSDNGICLESLPGAASFYENLGMTKRARRSLAGNLVYTLKAAKAEELLEEIKRQRIL
jgi:hypothetical protein